MRSLAIENDPKFKDLFKTYAEWEDWQMISFTNRALFVRRLVATFKFKLTALYNILAVGYNCDMP